MDSSLQLLFIFLQLLSLFLHGTSNEVPEPYIVYMGSFKGGKAGSPGALAAAHLKMLSSLIPSEEKQRLSLLHSYGHAFKGFSAMLTAKEAAVLSCNRRVVSVFPDRMLELHTTRSWDFLDAESGLGSGRARSRASRDVIIGLIDTGIWPESPSFSDMGMGEIPRRWRGTCMEGPDFKKSNCNRKLIGARFYASSSPTGSPRDDVGHGTHTASIAAGAAVSNASYYGLARGVARGGAPPSGSRVAMYKACSLGGCPSSAVLKAIDDATHDGVDILSISVGTGSVFQSDFLSDPIAIGAFHATQKGVLVVCSGGNDGPDPYTVINSAPWILTVAASSIDRSFQSNVLLGNGAVLQGTAINFSNLTKSATYPIVFGGDIAAFDTPVLEASNCYPGSLDLAKVAGKIVACVDTDPTVTRRVKKLVAEGAGAKGMVLVDVDGGESGVPFDSGSFPFSELGELAGAQALRYINSTKNPTATIVATVGVGGYMPAPAVAYFSSRGPGGLTDGILKPDVMAPGVGILASTAPVAEVESPTPEGKKPSGFAIKSGTSMSCPHVAGAAALVRSAHPRWSPSIIRSAVMTTTLPTNNMGKPVTTNTGSEANYHDMGAGEISPLSAISPGLVFETTTDDYLRFLCFYGYKDRIVRSVSGAIGANFSCPPGSSKDLIPTINYPSISVAVSAKAAGASTPATVSVSRTATNVGPANSTFSADVVAPAGVAVTVSPERLVFRERWAKASYQVTFQVEGGAGAAASKGYKFGSLTWSDGAHFVRTVFVVNVM